MSAITDKKKYLVAEGTYEKKAQPNINGFSLIYDGKTIDAFLNKKTKEIIIGIRGTADVRDVKTDITLLANRLANSSRYADDVSQFKSIVIAYPPSEYTYHLASHSLGGAIAKQLLRNFPFIKSSLGFNPAKQTKDLNDYDERNTDYYINKDALYNTFGKMSKDKKKVFEYKPKKTSGFFSWIKQKATPTFINAHLLDNFKPIVGAGIPHQRRCGGLGLCQGVSPPNDGIRRVETLPSKTPEVIGGGASYGGASAKYVPEGLSKRDKKKQIESIKKQTIRPKVDYPQRKSKWTKKAEDYFKGDTSIENISKVTGVPVKGLKLVIKKGEKAYYSSGSRPNIHPVQWGTARLYSLLFGNELVRRMDKDIIEKYNIPNLGDISPLPPFLMSRN